MILFLILLSIFIIVTAFQIIGIAILIGGAVLFIIFALILSKIDEVYDNNKKKKTSESEGKYNVHR